MVRTGFLSTNTSFFIVFKTSVSAKYAIFISIIKYLFHYRICILQPDFLSAFDPEYFPKNSVHCFLSPENLYGQGDYMLFLFLPVSFALSQ